MRKAAKSDYKGYISWAERNTANRVYPLSIAEGFQAGDIYTNDGDTVESVFFWHYCGFGYISGKPSAAFLSDIYRQMISEQRPRRLVLITDDGPALRFFRDKEVRMIPRVEYKYSGRKTPAVIDTERFRIEPVTAENIGRIEGRIVPAFSWESGERFLKNGFGYAAVEGETVCAVAFSSAVSSGEIDIGVETREEYRRNGLARALAEKMCGHITRLGKKPVWAHAASNLGSGKTALSCGFAEDRRITIIKYE